MEAGHHSTDHDFVVDTFHCHTQEPMIIYHLAGGFQVERILPLQLLPMRGWDHSSSTAPPPYPPPRMINNDRSGICA